MPKQLKVLSVMHNAPLQSTFLTEKFVRLNQQVDMHMLVWDSAKNAKKFSEAHNVAVNKIHSGISRNTAPLIATFSFLYLLLFNSRIRKYIFNGSLVANSKKILGYLPVFFLKPDVMHFEFGTLAKDIILLRQLTDAKMIVSFRGYDMYYAGLNDKDYYKDVWQYADGMHFLGNDLKQHGISRGYDSKQVEAIIPPAIDVDFFAPSEKRQTNKVFNIVSVGRLTWRKGYDQALQAMKHLKDMGLEFHYTIVGSGEHLTAIQFMIKELGLEREVTLTGSLNKEAVRTMLNNTDLFLQASVSEGFCNAVLEAQSMSLPVVCTDAGGLVENVVDGVTGFIVPKWDAKAMTDKIAWCINNKHLLPQIGEQGRQRVKQHFDVQDQINKFVAFYNSVYASR